MYQYALPTDKKIIRLTHTLNGYNVNRTITNGKNGPKSIGVESLILEAHKAQIIVRIGDTINTFKRSSFFNFSIKLRLNRFLGCKNFI